MYDAGSAEPVLQDPPELARQRGERDGQLIEEPMRGGVHGLGRDEVEQPFRMVVDAAQHDLADAALAQREEDRSELRRHRRVENQPQ